MSDDKNKELTDEEIRQASGGASYVLEGKYQCPKCGSWDTKTLELTESTEYIMCNRCYSIFTKNFF